MTDPISLLEILQRIKLTKGDTMAKGKKIPQQYNKNINSHYNIHCKAWGFCAKLIIILWGAVSNIVQ